MAHRIFRPPAGFFFKLWHAESLVVACRILSYGVQTLTCRINQFSSVAQSCQTLRDPMYCSMPGFPVHHQLPVLTNLMSIKLVMPSNHLIICCPLLLPSIFPSIEVFSNVSSLHQVAFSISPSDEYTRSSPPSRDGTTDPSIGSAVLATKPLGIPDLSS